MFLIFSYGTVPNFLHNTFKPMKYVQQEVHMPDDENEPAATSNSQSTVEQKEPQSCLTPTT